MRRLRLGDTARARPATSTELGAPDGARSHVYLVSASQAVCRRGLGLHIIQGMALIDHRDLLVESFPTAIIDLCLTRAS